MNKIRIFSWLMLLLIITGCVNSERVIKQKIYQTFFEGIDAVAIPKPDPPEHYKTVVDGKELEILINEMKNIKDIKEYSSNAALFGGFKEGFRVLFVHKIINQKRNFMLLYSTEKSAMIVRKWDLFPEIEVKLPNIEVYEFKVSEKVVDILKNHENSLPNSGFYITSWPADFIKK